MSTPMIKGSTGLWEVVIGLEIHAQVKSNAKLFSRAPTEFGADPNTQVSFIDAGFPGMLPTINRFCVEQAIRTGLGLNSKINLDSTFDRKNYFYADLPSGYQISQYKHPIVGEGEIEIDLENGDTKKIGIERLHLEQDAGKSIHDQHPTKSLIDLNRAGVALMEIVTRPDMRSAEEAMACVKKIRSIVRYLDTCDGNMERGNMRADVNVSLHRPGEPYGTRAEIKNVNSIRFIGQAIEFEIARQLEILEDGGEVEQETRLFDPSKGETRSMRSKEDAHDYRYFPDPDLPPLKVEASWVEEIKSTLPELPDEKRKRLVCAYELNNYDATVLVSEREVADFYESALDECTVKNAKTAKLLANWMLTELFALLNKRGLSIGESKVTAKSLAELVCLIADDTISGKIAKDVFSDMWETGESPASIVKAKGLQQVSDDGAIESAVDEVLKANGDMVAEYKAGKDKLFGFFVGQVMKATGGKVNPGKLNEILKSKLVG